MTGLKEFYMAASLAYHELALTQMGPTHRDYPQVLLHVSDLRHRLQAIRSKLSSSQTHGAFARDPMASIAIAVVIMVLAAPTILAALMGWM